MSGNILYRLDPLLVCLGLIGVLIAASEIGFWVRKRWQKGGPAGTEKGDIALILGAVLTLMALLFAFTYAMSESRYEMRRQLVIEEANAIGTTYLRAKTLPEPLSSEIQELLRQYTALRLDIGKMSDTPENIRELDTRTKQMHSMMWSHAAALAGESPNPITSIFLQSLNEMIDLHTKRLAAFRNRVPSPIYLVLFAVSTITLWLVGFYFGSHRQRARILTIVLALLVAAVM